MLVHPLHEVLLGHIVHRPASMPATPLELRQHEAPLRLFLFPARHDALPPARGDREKREGSHVTTTASPHPALEGI